MASTIPSPIGGSAAAGPLSRGGRFKRWVADDRAWYVAALVGNLLLGVDSEEASNVAWLNPLLFVVAIAIRTVDRRWGQHRVQLSGWKAMGGFVLIGWTAGMIVEATIAKGGSGYGGMHDETAPSFIMAQGYYVSAVVATWWAVRRYGLDARRAFFFAGAMAWWEALTVGALAMISPYFPFAPLLGAYYIATYALIGMAALLFIDSRTIAAQTPRRITTRRLVVYGAIAGPICWLIFVGWSTFAARAFGFEL